MHICVQSALTGWVAGVSFVVWIATGSMIYSTDTDSLAVPTAKCLNTFVVNQYVFCSPNKIHFFCNQ